MAQAISRPLPHPMLLAGAPMAPRPAAGRALAWAGSAGLHVVAGLVLLFGMPAPAPEVMPVMLLEMPAPEPAALPESAPPEPAPVEPAMVAEAAPTEPPPEPPVAEAPPAPQPPLAEAMPAPQPVPEPAEPALAELPMPPPLPRPPPPQHRPAPPRPAAAAAQPQPAAPAAASAPAASAPAAAAPVAPAPAAAPPATYIARLFAALERHKTYPQEARYRHVQGVAMLHFRMRRDGTVIAYRLERSAGDAALDAAVLAMIERASPLPAAPAELAGDSIELTVPVRFALR
jgi:periplasmic protein TonB